MSLDTRHSPVRLSSGSRVLLAVLGVLVALGGGVLPRWGELHASDAGAAGHSAPMFAAAPDVDDDGSWEGDDAPTIDGFLAGWSGAISVAASPRPARMAGRTVERDRRPETLVGTVVLLV